MSRILVTGGAGYIGSHTRFALQKHGHSVVVVDNLSRGYREAVPESMLRVLDPRQKDKITDLLKEERIEAVIHFAAYISVGESTQAPELYFANNVAGSLALFEAMIESRGQQTRFFFDRRRLRHPGTCTHYLKTQPSPPSTRTVNRK